MIEIRKHNPYGHHKWWRDFTNLDAPGDELFYSFLYGMESLEPMIFYWHMKNRLKYGE